MLVGCRLTVLLICDPHVIVPRGKWLLFPVHIRRRETIGRSFTVDACICWPDRCFSFVFLGNLWKWTIWMDGYWRKLNSLWTRDCCGKVNMFIGLRFYVGIILWLSLQGFCHFFLSVLWWFLSIFYGMTFILLWIWEAYVIQIPVEKHWKVIVIKTSLTSIGDTQDYMFGYQKKILSLIIE